MRTQDIYRMAGEALQVKAIAQFLASCLTHK
ncbi:MAG: hypothetical protein CLLPBCKN_008076 [Chroococcidiopsis cubana SAG 39.79]|nr:hypothetical protein [Chroococcidiopsis cubana SAG 39.79]